METKNIYQRLHAAMSAVTYVQKEAKKAGLQYSFASHDGVTAKVRPALLDAGIVTTVTVKSHAQDGNRTEANLVVRFVNIDKPDDFVEVESFGYGIDQQDKGPGKAVSYATKYAFLKTLCLETGDDPERDQIPHEPAKNTGTFERLAAIKTGWTQEDLSAMALGAVAHWNAGEKERAWKLICGLATARDEVDTQASFWKRLQPHSALRRFIKEQTDMVNAARIESPITEEA